MRSKANAAAPRHLQLWLLVSACAVYDIMNGLFGECNRRKRVANPLSVGRVLACGREFEDRCTLGFNSHSTFGTMGCALHYIGLIQGWITDKSNVCRRRCRRMNSIIIILKSTFTDDFSAMRNLHSFHVAFYVNNKNVWPSVTVPIHVAASLNSISRELASHWQFIFASL